MIYLTQIKRMSRATQILSQKLESSDTEGRRQLVVVPECGSSGGIRVEITFWAHTRRSYGEAEAINNTRNALVKKKTMEQRCKEYRC